VFLVLFLACSVFQPLDGTWLFQLDPNATITGDCAPDDSGAGEYEQFGTSNTWVDIYTVSGNQIAILWGEPMLGTFTGTAVEAGYESGYTFKKHSESHSVALEATLSGGSMEGSVLQTNSETNDGDEYNCNTQNDFTAVRSVSSPDSFAGN
jgi:hypothetical protein